MDQKKHFKTICSEFQTAQTHLEILKKLKPIFKSLQKPQSKRLPKELCWYDQYIYYWFIAHLTSCIFSFAKILSNSKVDDIHNNINLNKLLRDVNGGQKLINSLNKIRNKFKLYDDFRDQYAAHMNNQNYSTLTYLSLPFLNKKELPAIKSKLSRIITDADDLINNNRGIYCDNISAISDLESIIAVIHNSIQKHKHGT